MLRHTPAWATNTTKTRGKQETRYKGAGMGVVKNIIPTTALLIEYKMKGVTRMEERGKGREEHDELFVLDSKCTVHKSKKALSLCTVNEE